MQGDLSALGAEHRAFAADDIADIQFLKAVVLVLAQIVHLDVDLDASVLVLQIAEGRLAHASLGHQAAGDLLRRAFQFLELFLDLGGVARAFETGHEERVSALCLQRGQLLSADETLFAQILRSLFFGLRDLAVDSFFAHFSYPLMISMIL